MSAAAAPAEADLPQPGSLPWRVLRHFQRHREDELDSADLVLKFDGRSVAAVDAALVPAVGRGWLNVLRVKRQAAVLLYAAGPLLDGLRLPSAAGAALAPVQAAHAEVAASRPGPGPGRRRGFVPVEIAAIPVAEPMPLPSFVRGGGRVKNDWPGLLDQLKAVGMRAGPVDAIHRSALAKVISSRHKECSERYHIQGQGVAGGGFYIWRIA